MCGCMREIYASVCKHMCASTCVRGRLRERERERESDGVSLHLSDLKELQSPGVNVLKSLTVEAGFAHIAALCFHCQSKILFSQLHKPGTRSWDIKVFVHFLS